MFTSMLQLAISMILLYLLLSAASSALQEIFANLLHWRADTLEKGIARLFDDEDFKDELYEVPLISGLLNPKGGKPSYIPPATFALAVLHLAGKKDFLPTGSDEWPETSNPIPPVANSAANQPPDSPGPPQQAASPGAEALLRSLLLGANTVQEQKKRLEDWFNDSTERISGWYKRKTNAALWVIGAVICVLANADSISLANTFWSDPVLRSAMVSAATEYVKTAPKPNGTGSDSTANKHTDSNLNAAAQNPQAAAAGKATSPNSNANDAQNSNALSPDNTSSAGSDKDAFQRLNDVRTELSKINVPLGWCWESVNDKGEKEKNCFPNLAATGMKDVKTVTDASATQVPDPRMIPGGYGWLLKILGLAATALAVSQGAPFWFDLLQKAANVRLAGNAPDEKPKK
jgi:hypothetical protein